MNGIHITVVGNAHEYTRSRLPWRIDAGCNANCEVEGETTTGKKFGWKLFHYLSGGGMKSFGRTLEQDEADARRDRFLVASAVVGAGWLFFWFT